MKVLKHTTAQLFSFQAPKVFVDTIIEVQLNFENLLQNAFSKNATFSRAIDKGCERFINRNAITEALGSPRKTPELVAKYTDILLRKGYVIFLWYQLFVSFPLHPLSSTHHLMAMSLIG